MHEHRTAWILPVLLVAVVVGYGLFEARSLIVGPILVVETPTPGATLEGPLFEIRGNARNVTRVRINGHQITTDLSGAFVETRVTPDGIGVLLIEAENRFGRTSEVRMQVWGRP
jgi:hypothetical protein